MPVGLPFDYTIDSSNGRQRLTAVVCCTVFSRPYLVRAYATVLCPSSVTVCTACIMANRKSYMRNRLAQK